MAQTQFSEIINELGKNVRNLNPEETDKLSIICTMLPQKWPKVINMFRIIGYLAIFIVTAFIILFIVMQREITKNWGAYKCNPMAQQFAGMFGKDGQAAYDDCLSQNLSNAADKYTGSFKDTLGALGGKIQDIGSHIQSNAKTGLSLTSSVTSGLKALTTEIGLIFATAKLIMIKILAIVFKIVTVFWVCVLALYSSMQTALNIFQDKDLQKAIDGMSNLV